MVGVIDCGSGNLGSVANALRRISVPMRFAAGPEELSLSSSPFEKILFPGDGHFATAMASLEKTGYAQAIREWAQADRPFLGICIGMQLLFDSSEEAPPVGGKAAQGLSILPGTVRRFPGRKIPHIGWSETRPRRSASLFRGLGDDFFYYIHSYYADPADRSVCAAEAEYGLRYCCAVERGALAAVQFHPEKSGAAGIVLLRNWAEGSSDNLLGAA